MFRISFRVESFVSIFGMSVLGSFNAGLFLRLVQYWII